MRSPGTDLLLSGIEWLSEEEEVATNVSDPSSPPPPPPHIHSRLAAGLDGKSDNPKVRRVSRNLCDWTRGVGV